MRYIINEHQYKLLLEQDDILRIPFAAFGNDWDVLQRFLNRRGNPPYMIMDDLDLGETNVESLGNLTSVGGFLNLYKSIIEDLGNLTSVGGNMYLGGSKIKTLGNLTSVGGKLDLLGAEIESLGNLTSVGEYLNLYGTKIEDLGNLTSVGGNLILRKTPLSKKYSEDEIRSMVEVEGKIYL
jgi:hypothetical protein